MVTIYRLYNHTNNSICFIELHILQYVAVAYMGGVAELHKAIPR